MRATIWVSLNPGRLFIRLLNSQTFWAIVPAAGSGERMGGEIPKQYLKLHGKPILAHTLEGLLAYPRIKKIIVVIAPNDTYWPSIADTLSERHKIMTTHGGQARYDSVLNGLSALSETASENDWVLVHDAVRPCLSHQDLDHLIENLVDHPIGGVLGYPVRDTLKHTDDTGHIVSTLNRSNIWQAQTPQMFRYGYLHKALQHAVETGQAITDEAGALELMGYHPKMVLGHPNNIKITHPEDLAWVERYWEPPYVST